MRIDRVTAAALARNPGVETWRETGGAFAVAAVAVAIAAAWFAISLAFIQGPAFWVEEDGPRYHLALNVICVALAASHAARIHGSLEHKLAQALAAVALIFGVFAFVLLGTRMFFSRPLLVSSAAEAVVVSWVVVWLRHRLTRKRVAVIGPLLNDTPLALPFGRVISDPQTDLRGFDMVLVSLNETVSATWARALSRAMLAGVKVRHVGEYVEELRGAISLDHFDVDHLPPGGIASYRLLKRIMDVGLVIFFLPVVALVVLVASAAVLLTMGRPIFFLQERVGLGGRIFRMWKLRTMRPEHAGASLRATVPNDDRITPVGRLLRRFRIDELPQVWNVLKGDMSLIGPRPEAVPLHTDYMGRLPNYAYRYLVRPGITGWAQVKAPPSATAEEARHKLTYDLFYVKKLSLLLDLQILARTFWTLTTGGGVR